VEIELFPYIYSFFKIAMSQSNGLRIKDVVKLYIPDISQSSRMFAVELCYQFWSGDFESRLLEIVFVAISFLLDKVLESSPVLVTVKYLFYFPLCFSINDNRQ